MAVLLASQHQGQAQRGRGCHFPGSPDPDAISRFPPATDAVMLSCLPRALGRPCDPAPSAIVMQQQSKATSTCSGATPPPRSLS